MDPTLSHMLAAMTERLKALMAKRAEHYAQIREIDEQLGGIARQLGLDPAELLSATPELPRLAKVDKRTEGTIPARVMEYLLKADQAHTRKSLKHLMLADPDFGSSIRHNENTFYNAVARYIRQGKIVEIDGALYHPDRAPLPDGEDDPTGKHLPSNVSSLFGTARQNQ